MNSQTKTTLHYHWFDAHLSLIPPYLGYGIPIQYKVFVAGIVHGSVDWCLYSVHVSFTLKRDVKSFYWPWPLFCVWCHAGTKHVFQGTKRIQKLFQDAKRSSCPNYISQQVCYQDIQRSAPRLALSLQRIYLVLCRAIRVLDIS